ncbi:MAG: malate synthase G [Intrasporangiaceae bacterium]|nr:malate synthase G [Intrasporangiaceae bacterium]
MDDNGGDVSVEGSIGERVERHGLRVAVSVARFLESEVLTGTGITADGFWAGFAAMVEAFGPRHQRLLEVRRSMQAAIDRWHQGRSGQPHDPQAYERFLRELGYLVDEGPDVTLDTDRLDPEIADIAGPQLVVPVTNARYAINAANARWGSLYDALYGTDALGDLPPSGPYDDARGQRVIAWGRAFLDDIFPLQGGSHADAVAYRLDDGVLAVETTDGATTTLADHGQLVGHAGAPSDPTAVLLRNHGLVVELRVDRSHPIGASDRAGVADIVLESAVSVIMDCEDAVATVDAEDKVVAYRNWLGLMCGDLTAEVEKDGRSFTRRMADDREYVAADGGPAVLHGRSLMLVRIVGNHLYTDAVLDQAGEPIPEGFLDAMVTVACALHDLRGDGQRRNSRAGSVYVVKPKLHGPDEVALTDELLHHVERVLGLAPNTVKIGVMDEERRTSANLKECIRAARNRLAFINTGFLDRTGDEIHTSMEAGPMVRKAEMKSQPWIRAYEDRNVDIGLACGLRGRAQIGKGMWAAPDLMAAMLEEKLGHPRSGANCAWVPSPTAATLHATHYHRVDVAARQEELAGQVGATLDDLLTIPVDPSADWDDDGRVAELENNAQGILGYVVRWVDQGVGSSKVPDINGVALMEDRATCRISSQHMANWLRHGVTSEDEVMDVMRRMAGVVDEQNAGDPAYIPMAPGFDGPAFRAAVALVLDGAAQPAGYIEPILYAHRRERKQAETRAKPR